jgi:hypothetical protein
MHLGWIESVDLRTRGHGEYDIKCERKEVDEGNSRTPFFAAYYCCSLSLLVQLYRLNHKYMRRPRLMKMHKSLLDKNCLSSDVVSIALAYCLNSPHPSLKYGIQFFVIETIQNLLQRLKELIFVSQLNPFESFFDCRKQVEVAGCQIR